MPSLSGRTSKEYRGWLFVDTEAVPERWRDRAVEVSFVPLLPEELAALLHEGTATPGIGPKDEPLAVLLASGLSVVQIAGELGMSRRGVQHRLELLRGRFGVDSTAELRALMARRGF